MLELISTSVLPGEVLVACEGLARTSQEGREAFLTWSIAQGMGWSAACDRLKPEAFWRHVRLLRSVGALVVDHTELTGRHSQGERIFWSRDDDIVHLLPSLPGARFRLTAVWRNASFSYLSGSTGKVLSVHFKRLSWSVLVEFDDDPGGKEEIPLAAFLDHAEPEYGATA